MDNNTSSIEWPVTRVRRTFVEFFEKYNHTFVPSSPVVPHEDPTLLFANSGMNQFKPIFLGNVDPKNPLAKLKRAANSQKCIRAGGKHNDLEDVGKDTYHHTFFEMLGNWSFGDYFKKEAIQWHWELLTQVYGVSKDRLYATYFGGNEKFGLKPDEEARQLWLQYLPSERVLPFGMKENFWEMGDTGPCGPCTEIHYDRIGGREVPTLVNADDPMVIEVCNLVFMQFNREPGGNLKPLPACHVDTGMGLERMTSILQNKYSNYDTDLFAPIFAEIQRLTGARPYSGKLGAEDTDNVDMAYRVIADHIRTLSFAITDGAAPGNEGRNYVLRRILRRAVRYGHQVLKGKPGFFSQLVKVVVDTMQEAFPELAQHYDRVCKIIQSEEKTFERTLDKGIEHFNKAAERMINSNNGNNKVFSGEDAFTLYDTYGFPVDLTQLMAAERGLTVDMAQYENLMDQARTRSRLAQQTLDVAMNLDANATAHLSKQEVPVTDDSFKYILQPTTATVKAIWNGKEFAEHHNASGTIGVIFDRSNFYSESGGQIFDTGSVVNAEGLLFEVQNVQAYAGYVLHIGRVTTGSVQVGTSCTLEVDTIRRLPTMSNHTFTHVLNFALRKVLGKHVDQKGSLVDHEKLRFDFSHDSPLTNDEIVAVEQICSDIIRQNLAVYRQAVGLEVAKRINGLRAVFGETYPDPVTVVSIGVSVADLVATPENPDWVNYSIELCGGTHIGKTNEAKHFVVVSETGIAKGVRRLIAYTGALAEQSHSKGLQFQQRINEAKNKKDEELSKEISVLQTELASLPIPASMKPAIQKELDALVSSKLAGKKNLLQGAMAHAEKLALQPAPVIVDEIQAGDDRKILSNALQLLKDKCPDSAVMLFSKDAKKVYIIANVPKSRCSQLDAGTWAKEVASVCGGKGGGKAESAQASGDDVAKLEEAMKRALTFANEKLQ